MTGLLRLLASIRVYTFLTLFLVLCFPIIIVVISIRSQEDSWPFVQRCFRAMLATAGVRYEAVGLEGLDFSRGYMMMGNHVNVLDHFILASIIPRPFVGFEKTANLKIPIYGRMMKRWGNVGVSRSADPVEAKRAAAEAADRLRQGIGFLVYPEGTRTRTGAIGPFKKGGFHTAVDAEAQILPFTYNGAREILAPGRWWAMPGLVTVTFAQPIDATAYGKERLDALMKATRAAIVASYQGEGAELVVDGGAAAQPRLGGPDVEELPST